MLLAKRRTEASAAPAPELKLETVAPPPVPEGLSAAELLALRRAQLARLKADIPALESKHQAVIEELEETAQRARAEVEGAARDAILSPGDEAEAALDLANQRAADLDAALGQAKAKLEGRGRLMQLMVESIGREIEPLMKKARREDDAAALEALNARVTARFGMPLEELVHEVAVLLVAHHVAKDHIESSGQLSGPSFLLGVLERNFGAGDEQKPYWSGAAKLREELLAEARARSDPQP